MILLILIPWLVYALIGLVGAGHAEVAQFVARPWNATLLILTLLSTLYHGALGLQVVIEDYVHQRGIELALHFLVKGISLLAAVLGVVHVLKLVLGA